MKRSFSILVLVLSLVMLTGLLTACGSSSTANNGAAKTTTAVNKTIKIGTLQTDDILPLWVAQKEGILKKAGLNVQIITFQSSQEQVAAMTAGDIDGMMSDMVVALQLSAAGTKMRAVTVMLQGAPVGIIARKGSRITSIEQLAGVKTGCSSNTVVEYVYDKALTDAGVPANKIKTEEIKKLPVRFQMLTSNKIDAAVLPWTFFTLAQASGATPLLSRQQSSAYTSTVLEFSDTYLQSSGASKDMKTLLSCWNQGVDKINANPDSYRSLLATNAKLPDPLNTTYKVSTYPKTALPDQKQFEDVVKWMVGKGYLKSAIQYNDSVYTAK